MLADRSHAGGQLRQLAKDLTAALRLFAQQRDVVGERRVRLDRALEFGCDHRDGRERRAELMRGRCREPVELGEVMFAREHELGCRQSLGELARLLGELPGVHADEAEREQHREPHAHDVDRRQLQRPLVGIPRQRIVVESEHGSAERRRRRRG